MPVARNVECDVHALRVRYSGIDFVLQPVFCDFLLNHVHVPRVFIAKISAASRDSESTFCPGGAESSVWSADRSAFSKRNLIRLFLRRGQRLFLGSRFLFLLRF